jgi:putative heme iron utilization protein
MLRNDPWELIGSLQSLILSTINSDGTPHCSYAPFIEKEQRFYISLSAKSTHSQNIMQTPTVSILFIEDESRCSNIFARKRVTFDVTVKPIERGSIVFNGAMTLFEDKFGEMASIYQTMNDFYLFELTPIKGRAVFGFGQAYDFKDGKFGNVGVSRGEN